MLKLTLVASAGISLLLSTVVLAQTASEPGAAVSAAVDAAGKVTESTDFVGRVTFSDLFEVRSSELALERSKSQEIRLFAERMIADHKASTEALMQAATQDSVAASQPTEVDSEGAEKMDQLRGATDNFDIIYQRMQIETHDEAIALFKSFSEGGETPALRSFAAEMLPKLQRHRDMLPAQPPVNN